jgi:hypothetical protein
MSAAYAQYLLTAKQGVRRLNFIGLPVFVIWILGFKLDTHVII